MAKHGEFWQVVNGVWSPRDAAYSYVVAGEFDSIKEARAYAKTLKGDPTVSILHVLTNIVWRVGEPPFAPPVWAQPQ